MHPWQGGGDREGKDPGFTWGICQHPEPKVNLNESGFSRPSNSRSRTPPIDEYPNRDGIPIRGKHFADPEDNPQSAAGYRPLPKQFDDILGRIEEWEAEHNPKPRPFKLDELQSPDYYKKVYDADRYRDITPDLIKLAPVDADLWRKYRLIEGMYETIQFEALKADRRPTVFRPLSKFPLYHDSLIQLRSQIAKRTGLNYRTVDRGLNHMLKKKIIADLRAARAYILDIRQVWNRTYLWHLECERIVEARRVHGPDWIKKDIANWQEYGDFNWPHRRRYCKEHETLI